MCFIIDDDCSCVRIVSSGCSKATTVSPAPAPATARAYGGYIPVVLSVLIVVARVSLLLLLLLLLILEGILLRSIVVVVLLVSMVVVVVLLLASVVVVTVLESTDPIDDIAEGRDEVIVVNDEEDWSGCGGGLDDGDELGTAMARGYHMADRFFFRCFDGDEVVDKSSAINDIHFELPKEFELFI